MKRTCSSAKPITTRADKEFYSSHGDLFSLESPRYVHGLAGFPQALSAPVAHNDARRVVSHTEHSHMVCAKPVSDEGETPYFAYGLQGTHSIRIP